MSPECQGCGCIKNYDNNSEFCGRLFSQDGKVSTVGCDNKCDECKLCNYPSNNKTPNVREEREFHIRVEDYLNNNNNNNTKLSKKEFIDFLKKQQMMDRNMIHLKKSNKNKKMDKNNNKNNKMMFEQINDDFGYENMEKEDLNETCKSLNKERCTIEKGCIWNKENVMCSDLEVVFYTAEKTNGSNFKLKVGIYDLNEIENLDFYPEFIAVPKGLRVKIWKKSGFSGQFEAFLGNYNSIPEDIDLYPINFFGSIQVCNMVTCSKPSEHYHLKLINVLSGNNIDEVEEEEVSNIEEYKKNLRKNIKTRLEYIKRTQNECLDDVVDYLVYNDINIKVDLEEIDNLQTLQKMKYILSNMPTCMELIDYNKFNKNKKENEHKKLLKDECPKYLLNLKKTHEKKIEKKEEEEYKMKEADLKLFSPSFINDLREKVDIESDVEKPEEPNTIFKQEDFILIILISIVLLLLILAFILYKFLSNNKSMSVGKNNFYNNRSGINKY